MSNETIPDWLLAMIERVNEADDYATKHPEIAREACKLVRGLLGHGRDLVGLLIEEVERLQAVMDAVEAFLAESPVDMRDGLPFNQYTTAADCRALNKAYREAVEPAAKPGS